MVRSLSYFGRSGRYTLGHEQATLASHGARTAANSAAYLLPVLQQGMSMLDVGCGPGTITLDLAEIVAPGAAVGVENVEEPLAAARSLDRRDSRRRRPSRLEPRNRQGAAGAYGRGILDKLRPRV